VDRRVGNGDYKDSTVIKAGRLIAQFVDYIIDTGLPYRRARSYGAQAITFDLLAQAFTINSVARFRAAKRIASAEAA